LSVLPLCFGGAFTLLLITGSELDVPSMVGLIMLLEIVTKNSILLVDCTLSNIRRNKMDIHAALVDACTTRIRAVVMTSLAMIAGMLPIALGFGADASFRQPMAFAAIGGLVTSTALSLLVVPVVFTYVDKLQKASSSVFERTTTVS
jgi:multidrug efflux pump subunit AcrB